MTVQLPSPRATSLPSAVTVATLSLSPVKVIALAEPSLTLAARRNSWPTPSTGVSLAKCTDSGAGTTVTLRLAVRLLKFLAVTTAVPTETAVIVLPSGSTRSTSGALLVRLY